MRCSYMFCGASDDDGVSDKLKVHISFTDDGGTKKKPAQEVNIVGYLIEGSSVSLANSYIEPFTGDTIDGIDEKFEKGLAFAKAMTDVTFNTVMNSVSVWEGTNPITMSLTLYFHAYTDAKNEVMEPIRQILRAASPELNQLIPIPLMSGDSFGRVPKMCMFDIGRKIKIEMAIDDVQYEINAPKTQDGDFAYNTVTISCTMKKNMQRSTVYKHFIS